MNKKFLFSVILFIFTFSFNFSLAYKVELTHRDLTKKIIEIYNKHSEIKITKEQADWIIQGSIEEDTVPRWINHFYDPVYKNGWSGEKQGDVPQETVQKLSKIFISSQDAVPSLDWLHNNDLQDKYGLYKGNQTYDRAVENYAWAVNSKNKAIDNAPSYANFENAFKALGHTLHLLEDLGVPAHTRNDTHADVSFTKDTGEPYEKWAAEFGTLSVLDSLKSSDLNFNCQTIDECFVSLAKYTNENFYSKDTIDDKKYKFLKSSKVINLDSGDDLFFRKDKFGNEYLFKIHTKKDDKDTIEDNQIHQAYWNLLSKQIVLSGVQALKIFFQNDTPKEIENFQYKTHFVECDIPVICAKDKMISPFGEFTKLANAANSFLGNVANTVKNTIAKTGGFIKNILGSGGLNQTAEIDLNSQNFENRDKNDSGAGDVQQKTKIGKADETQALKDEIKILKKEIVLLDDELNNKNRNQKNEKPRASTTINDTITKTIEAPTVDFCKFSTSQKPSHSGIIINEIAWMGSVKSASDEWIELKNITDRQIDLSGWQLVSKDGQIKINLSGLKNVNSPVNSYILFERTDDNAVLGIPADIIYKGGLSNSDEKLRLFDSSCNLIDEVSAGSSWPAGDNVAKKTMERNTDSSYPSSLNVFGWHTSNVVGGTPRAANSEQVVYSGGGGGGGTSSSNNSSQNSGRQAAQAQFYNIAINEIMYNPDGEDAGREWIEIFNKETFSVDLSGFKLFGGGTNHGLILKQGNKNLAAGGYAIIANDAGKFLADYPNYSGIIFESSFSLNNAGETIIFKNNDLKIDEVDYKSDWGANGNGNSLQLIDGVWKEGLPTPGKINKIAASIAAAKFSFFPAEPKENEQIVFDAASSTAGSGGISLYEWRFSDNVIATSTIPAMSRFFSAAGIYSVQLVVYGDNASSTISAAVSVVSQNRAKNGINHVVISEIMPSAGMGRSDEEFIELYNPTDSDVDLTSYSLKRKSSAAATSTQTLVASSNFKGKSIAAKGFFLAASPEYKSLNAPDVVYSSQSYRLANNDDVVILYSGSEIIDKVDYVDIVSGQSFERKAFSNGGCVSSQNNNEFLGNGCNTGDNSGDFEIRILPNPQNSSNLPEPRNAPLQVQNFNIQYNKNGPVLNFNWSPSVDYRGASSSLTYKITDAAASSSIFIIQTTSTEAGLIIDEVGRTGDNAYKFFIQAFDKDGLASAPSNFSIEVPSFLSNVYFFKNQKNSSDYFIEGYYDKYPFVPKRFSDSDWKVAIFYLNQDAPKTLNFGESDYWGGNVTGALKLIYKACTGYDTAVNNAALILPDSIERCSVDYGGIRNNSFNWNNLEDLHFIAKIDSSSANFKEGDYATIAFYAYDGNNGQQLVAVDKKHYPLLSVVDWQKSPQWPAGAKLGVNLDKKSSKLNVSWPKATDADSMDSLITYEIKYASSSEWQMVSNNGHATGTEKFVSPGDDFQISVRAKDDFGNSDPGQILSAPWSYPKTTFYIEQVKANDWSMNFGDKNPNCAPRGCPVSASLQSITPKDDFQFNKVVLRVWQANDPNYSYNADLRLRVYTDNNGVPSENILGESVVYNLVNPDKNSDITFSFNSPVSLIVGNKYWLILDVSGYIDGRGYYENYWKNAVSTANDYLDGDAGWSVSADSPQYTIPYPPGADWYMKIGLE